LEEWRRRLREEGGPFIYSEAYEKAGISRVAYYTGVQGLYDETMAHNDYQLGRLVERLKAEGEWENTLLIVAADHSIAGATQSWGEELSLAIHDSLPPPWIRSVLLRPSITRIPLLFVWPGHILGGQRFSQPVVSMIDVFPTVLDLVGSALPEVMQGQSLAPLLLGEGIVEPRRVVLEEFGVDQETGESRGVIEVIDGRWGASLAINGGRPRIVGNRQRAYEPRPVPLLLYDLWDDPYCLRSLHEERLDLVEEYTAFLEAQFEAHKALGQFYTPGEDVVLTPEVLEMLRTFGYIR